MAFNLEFKKKKSQDPVTEIGQEFMALSLAGGREGTYSMGLSHDKNRNLRRHGFFQCFEMRERGNKIFCSKNSEMIRGQNIKKIQ